MGQRLVALNLREGLVALEVRDALEQVAAVIAEVGARTRGAKVKFSIGLSMRTDTTDMGYRPEELAAIKQIKLLCKDRNLPVTLRGGGPSGRWWYLEFGV